MALLVTTTAIYAQDTLTKSAAAPAQYSIQKLQRNLGREVNTADDAKALFDVARALNYSAGQVVALSRLALIYDRNQQVLQVKTTLRDAVRISKKITDVDDGEWAIETTSDIKDDYSTPSRDFKTGISILLAELGKGMAKSTLGLSDKELANFQESNKISAQINEQVKRMIGHAVKNEPDMKNHKGFMNKFVDQWLDTIIKSGNATSKGVEKLVVQKNKRDANKALSNDFAVKGNYAEAYKYYLQYTAYKDSLTLEATSRRVASLQYKQTLLKKEAAITLLTKDRQLREQKDKRQQQFMFGLFGFIVLLVSTLVILGRNNRAKKRINFALNVQKDELQHALSELKIAQEQLIQSEKMASLGELTAGIAHEIQNPLNFVNNFSEVSTEMVREVMEERQNPDYDREAEADLLNDIEQNLVKINEHGNRASSIIKGMLEHSRSSSGQKQITDLNALIEEYLKLSYHGLRARDSAFHSKMTTNLQSDLGEVSIVPQEIGRVLLNIFNNAFYAVYQRQKLKVNGYESMLTVTTLKQNGQVKIIIKDNGGGIPEHIRQKIFQPFFTTKPTGEGTGLGLSLSYDVITKGHGGQISVESQKNTFTAFTITLPTQ